MSNTPQIVASTPSTAIVEGEDTLGVEDQAILDPDGVRYIKALNESHQPYERFFDALLIKRSKHAAFFRDLRAFRQQGHIIRLLEPGTKESYRECSRQFIDSRFAHPWCRTAPTKDGWVRAEWGSIRKMSEQGEKDEQKLYGLLLPIWCRFRKIMWPGSDVVNEWIEKEREREASKSRVGADVERVRWRLGGDCLEDSNGHERGKIPGDASGEPRSRGPHHRRPELDRLSDDEEEIIRRDADALAATTAANFLVGMAATGILIKNKRIRNFLRKKMRQ